MQTEKNFLCFTTLFGTLMQFFICGFLKCKILAILTHHLMNKILHPSSHQMFHLAIHYNSTIEQEQLRCHNIITKRSEYASWRPLQNGTNLLEKVGDFLRFRTSDNLLRNITSQSSSFKQVSRTILFFRNLLLSNFKIQGRRVAKRKIISTSNLLKVSNAREDIVN